MGNAPEISSLDRGASGYDVVVCGGGSTGIAAAIAAANHGAHTLLIEYSGCVGGASSFIPGWLGFHALDGKPVVAGEPLRLLEALRRRGGATPFYHDPICGSVTGINNHWWKIVALQELENAGVDLMLRADLNGVERTGRRITGVVISTGGGSRRIPCRQLIDCTDSGVVAALAGERQSWGRSQDHKVQASSWVFSVGNINFEELYRYFLANPEQLRPFRLNDPVGHIRTIRDVDAFVMGAFEQLIREASSRGMKLPRVNMPGIAFPKEKRMVSVATRLESVDPRDPLRLGRATMEGAGQVGLWLRFLREMVPGFASCILIDTPKIIGMRETAHLTGRYTLTAEDLLTGRMFDDAIALGAYHMDIHSPDHKGLETRRVPIYSIPFRSLLGVENDNFAAAGRTISATHEANSSTRVIPIAMATGEAAGTAAALACRGRIGLADVDRTLLRETLRESGVKLDMQEDLTRKNHGRKAS